jgi:hypothetical protein
LTAEELFTYLSAISENNIKFRPHFLDRLETRSNGVVPDESGVKKILINTRPVYVEYQSKDGRFKVYYNVTEKYDLIIVMSLSAASPIKIELTTIYKQEAKRRLNKHEGVN